MARGGMPASRSQSWHPIQLFVDTVQGQTWHREACLYEGPKIGVPELDTAMAVAADHRAVWQHLHSPDAEALLARPSTCITL